MTFALKLLHKERLNLPCFRHSTSFNRCLSLESRTVSCDIYISTPPYQVVDYMIPFYPDPFGLFVNMEVGSIETQKKKNKLMSWLLKTWSRELIWWLATSGFFILVNIPPAFSQGVLVSFLSNICRFSWQTHAISKGRTKEISYRPIRTRNIITRSSHWSPCLLPS